MKILASILAISFSLGAMAQGQLQKEASGNINFTEDRILQLAEAVPAEKYDWRPGEGVRSFKEVFAHVIAANYFFGSKLGAKLPEGIDMMAMDKSLNGKADVTKALKQSQDFLAKAIQEAKDAEMSKKVEFPFPGEYTNMSAVLIAVSHANEHLGQLVAYSRVNNITPPWSMEEEN